MTRQRSTPSTSGRGTQSSTTAKATTRTTTSQQELGGGLSGDQTAGQTGAQTTTPTGTQTGAQGGGVMEKAQELAGQVQQKATQRVESGLARGKNQAAETLNSVAQSLITSGQQLRERNQQNVSRFVDQAADRVQRVSNYLRNTEVSEIIDSTEEFARRRPALFLGGAFALGLLGARFLKSSRRQQEKQIAGAGFAGGGARGRPGHLREGIKGIEQEVPTPRAEQEWAASGVGIAGGLADVAGASALESSPLSGGAALGRQRGPLDFGVPPGGPEASQR